MKANKNIFVRFSDFLENLPTKLPEIIVLFLYTVLLAFIAYFHEPWFDEAQSWLIARAASIKEMFFYIPHYEGHPPFWWLILAPFAKAGFPYEITLKTINISLCSFGMGLFLFKAPFKRVIKFLVPFTYFMFYQYGIVSRCYCLSIIAFMLAAITYQNRNIKPFAYVGSLMMLCASSAYGIVFSGGLAIVWLLEMWPFPFKDILQKRQFKALALLLVWALFLIYIIMPHNDVHAINLPNTENTFITRFLFLIFVIPFNSLLGIYMFQFLSETTLHLHSLIKDCLYALPFTIVLLIILKGFKKRLLFSVPYILFALFASIVYCSSWHRGFVFLFFIFVFWQIAKEKSNFIWPKFIPEDLRKLFREFVLFFIYFILLFSIGYCIYWCNFDIQNYYDDSSSIAKFIKEYKLEDKVIFAQWRYYSPSTGDLFYENASHINYVSILPYFDRNIINNQNFGDNQYPYNIHKIVDNQAYYKEWAKGPKPDILLGENFPLSMIWMDITKKEDDFINIALKKRDNPPIYMRRQLAKELGLIDKMIEVSKHKETI